MREAAASAPPAPYSADVISFLLLIARCRHHERATASFVHERCFSPRHADKSCLMPLDAATRTLTLMIVTPLTRHYIDMLFVTRAPLCLMRRYATPDDAA